MKTIQITKREQHVLMTCLRAVKEEMDAPGGKTGRNVVDQLSAQPGMGSGIVPAVYELDSLLERLSSNDLE